MPSARAATAMPVNPGFATRTRSEWRRSDTRLLILIWYEQPGAKFALACGVGHHGCDLAEDGADATGDSGHNGACRNRDEASHQSVFDKILALAIPPDPHEKKKGAMIGHYLVLLGR